MTNNQFGRFLFAIGVVYYTGMLVNVMDIDAAQYAAISREMLETGSYLHVYEQGHDYLDKPPLLFWLSSMSMSIFGATNFGYKFPSFLFAILAIFSTYRFARIFYSDTIAKLSALVLASSQALFMITNDCRTDTVLIGCVAFAIWQLTAAFTPPNEVEAEKNVQNTVTPSRDEAESIKGVLLEENIEEKDIITQEEVVENIDNQDNSAEEETNIEEKEALTKPIFIPKKHRKNLHFLLGFIGIGLGMLAKGPVALIVPAMAFAGHFIWKKEYANFKRVEYVWGLLIVGLILLPMSIGLYQQFDMHPEKVVNGQTGVSGLRFYYWIQSFGRITGENKWQNAVFFGYLLQTMFYTFLPWILLFLAGYITSVWNIVKRNTLFETKELITLSGFTLGYISLGLSKYQLPHYIFITFPFVSIITARFIVDILIAQKDWLVSKILRGVHWFVITVLWALPFLIMRYTFPSFGITIAIMAIVGVIYLISALQRKNIIISTVYTVISINFFLNLYFYRNLLTYQVGSEIGRFIEYNLIPRDKFFTYKYPATSSLHFYGKRTVKTLENVEDISVGDWLLTDEKGLAEIEAANFQVRYDQTGNSFSVTNLTPAFMNHVTRMNEVGQYYLLEVIGKVEEQSEDDIEEPIDN
jgi:4-amino-4-deoxy-L-arabinose transferase-like glycosyltransferase